MDLERPWLLLDTSAPAACVGVLAGGEVASEVRLVEARRHAEELPGAIDRALAEAGLPLDAIAAVAVGRGPGSFVGVRVALSTAKGICLARRVPLVGVGSLAALAGADGLPEGEGLAWLDARRGELYVQRVRREGGRVIEVDEPHALAPEEARAAVAGAGFGVGNGLELLEGARPAGPLVEADGPSARGLAFALRARLDAAGAELSQGELGELFSLVPAYCRPPDAKLPTR